MEISFFENAFKEKALADFHLCAVNHLPRLNFMREIEEASRDDIGELNYHTAKRKFKKLFKKYNAIFDNPSMLTQEDYNAIEHMRKYLRQNKGSEFGYFKYRRECYHIQMALFMDLVLKRNMELLANKLEFFEAVERRMELLDKYQTDAIRFNHHELVRSYKNKWSKKAVTCECGMNYTQGNKNAHIKTKRHKTFLLSKCATEEKNQPRLATMCEQDQPLLPECVGENIVIHSVI